jgi:hypothetical protein
VAFTLSATVWKLADNRLVCRKNIQLSHTTCRTIVRILGRQWSSVHRQVTFLFKKYFINFTTTWKSTTVLGLRSCRFTPVSGNITLGTDCRGTTVYDIGRSGYGGAEENLKWFASIYPPDWRMVRCQTIKTGDMKQKTFYTLHWIFTQVYFAYN